ncbi:hypothetical protein B0H14DRAFT_2571014 [Mycena olivaceomarginata]|nr:hypothetical protein B0H14DRAFT_2571014 [Mycena olivaceomarginata]
MTFRARQYPIFSSFQTLGKQAISYLPWISVYSTGSTSAGRHLRNNDCWGPGIFPNRSPGAGGTLPLQPVVFGISVLLIHLRAGLGWASDSGLAGSGSTENT